MTLKLYKKVSPASITSALEVRKAVDRGQRERLVAAMVAVVGEAGYAGASVSRVASRAGMSTKTFYRHFADRSDCFLAAYDDAVDDVVALAMDACRGASSPGERLEGAATAVLRHWAEQPAVARLCIVEIYVAPGGLERRIDTLRRLTALARGALVDGRRPGTRGRDVRLAPEVLVGGMFHVAYERVRSGGPADLVQLAQLTRWLSPAP